MIVARIIEHLHLGSLQSDGSGHRRILQLAVEVSDQISGSRIIDVPQCRQRAPGAGLDGDAREAEGRSIVALRRIAGAERQEVKWIVAELEQPDELIQT